MQIRCYFPDISYLSETQENNLQFLKKVRVYKHHTSDKTIVYEYRWKNVKLQIAILEYQ